MIDIPTTPGNNRVTPTSAASATAAIASGEGQSTNSSTLTGLKLLQQLPQQQTLQVQIKSVQTLSDSEMSLLEKVNPSLIQKIANSPSSQTTQSHPSNPLTGQNRPALYLASVVLNKVSTGNQLPLDVITNQKVNVGDIVAITVGKQQLELQPVQRQPLEVFIRDTLKQLLPQQQPVSQLQQFSQRLQQLPPTIQQMLVAKNVTDALPRLNQFSYNEARLQSAPQVMQALTNSGTQLEHKLVSSQPLTNDLRLAVSQIATKLTADPTVKPELTPQQQRTVQNFIAQIAPELVSALSTQTQASHPGATQTQQLPTATLALLQLLGIPQPARPQEQSLPQIVQQHLKQLLEKTQSQTLLNQIRSLGLDKAQQETRGTPVQHLHTELPLRYGDQVLPLQISIEEHDYPERSHKENDEEQSREGAATKKQRQWQVFMSFDLPGNEHLHTQLTLVGEHVSATLWAESASLCTTAQQNINLLRDKLLSKGLTVDDLTCVQGRPPQNSHKLDYQLVDVRT